MFRPETPTTEPSTIATSVVGGALVVANSRGQMLYQRHGTDMKTIVIGSDGPNQQKLVVHKKLFDNMWANFKSHFEYCPPADAYLVTNAPVAIVSQVYDYVYNDGKLNVATDENGSSGESVTKQIDYLFQLYVFAEKEGICEDFRNRVMDAIQDLLVRTNTNLSSEHIKKVYKHTDKASKLRPFCSQTLLFILQDGRASAKGHEALRESMLDFFMENRDILGGFLEAVQYSTRSMVDTRQRNCGKDPRCALCHFRVDHVNDAVTGISPCWFHSHDNFDLYKEEADGSYSQNRISDDCYFNAEVANAKFRI